MATLQTQINKVNYFTIKQMNNIPLENSWKYSWRVESNLTNSKDFYTIQEVAKENENIFNNNLIL